MLGGSWRADRLDGSALAQPAVLSAPVDATNGSSGPATNAVRDY